MTPYDELAAFAAVVDAGSFTGAARRLGQSKAAVSAFQAKNGISATGAMNDKTWNKLLPNLKQGSSGGSVRALQSALQDAGQSVSVNGTFDATTAKAVRSFQTKHRIKVTGEVSRLTWARLIG